MNTKETRTPRKEGQSSSKTSSESDLMASELVVHKSCQEQIMLHLGACRGDIMYPPPSVGA